MTNPDVLIAGGGLAGLCCALHLHRRGLRPVILEASDDVGGRVRTDEVDGFRLDRGFQVLLTAYPESRALLDYGKLDLRPFYPGALVRFGGRFYRMPDPARRPLEAFGAVLSPVGTVRDKLRVGSLRRHLQMNSLKDLFAQPEKTTLGFLREEGFSSSIIDRFFRPFFGGVFLDPGLATSSRMFTFLFRMFSEGDTAVPATGMGEIPRQLASALPEEAIRTNARVVSAEPGQVRLESGETLEAQAIVLAVEGPEAARLRPEIAPPASRAATCLYFAADRPPVREPILILNGEGHGPINNLHRATALSPALAPPGKELISATVLGLPEQDDSSLEFAVRNQLDGWFGPEVRSWQLLRVYRIAHAQPDQAPPALEPPQRPIRIHPGLYVCGDHRDTASIHGAMVSGRRAAEAIAQDLAS